METLAERESAMRSVLRHINETKTVKGLDQEQMKLLKECCDNGFLSGVQTEVMISGRVIAECQRDVRLTLEGLQFLESVESSAEDLEESSADDDQQTNQNFSNPFHIIKTIIKKSWALFCALGVIVTVFGWPLITKAFSFLLSLFHA